MRKRLVKKLEKKSRSKKVKELSPLENLMVLAHRINQTTEGCVFINDSAHVGRVQFRISDNKSNYALKSEFTIDYSSSVNLEDVVKAEKKLKEEAARLEVKEY